MTDYYDLAKNENLWNAVRNEVYREAAAYFASGVPYNDGNNSGWWNIASNMKTAGFSYDEVDAITIGELAETQWDSWDADNVGASRGFLRKTFDIKLPPPDSHRTYTPPVNNPVAISHDAFAVKEWRWLDFEDSEEGIETACKNAEKLLQKLYRNGPVYYTTGTGDNMMKPHPGSAKKKEKPNADWLNTLYRGDSGRYLAINGAVDGETMRKGVVTYFRYGFVEFDPDKDSNIDKNDFIKQLQAQLEKLSLPWIGAVYSGNKSIHVYLKIDAKDEKDWQKRMEEVYAYIRNEGIESIDDSGKEITRWCRFPVGHRYQGYQYVMAINDKPLNFSEWRKMVNKDNVQKKVIISPMLNSKGKVKPTALLEFLSNLGFKVHLNKDGGMDVVFVKNEKFVKKTNIPEVISIATEKFCAEEKNQDVVNIVLSYLRSCDSKFLAMLPRIEMSTHTDNADAVYLYYQNGVLKVEKDNTELLSYDEVDGYIWMDTFKTSKREYIPVNETTCQYEKFIERITGDKNMDGGVDVNSANLLNAKTIIGYLISRYKDPATAKAVLITDRKAAVDGDTSTGGTGKGVFVNALEEFRCCGGVDGKDLKNDERFGFSSHEDWQSIFAIQDIKKDFSFEGIYNKITGKFDVEKKGIDKRVIDFEKAPKIILTSNFIPKNLNQESTKRRLVLLELENYYNANYTPLDEFGTRFFVEWDDEEWMRFDAFIISCIQLFLEQSLQPYETEDLKRKKITSSINQSVLEWLEGTWIPNNRQYLDGTTKITREEMWKEYEEKTRFQRYTPATSKSFGENIKKYFDGGIIQKKQKTGQYYYIDLKKCILNLSDEQDEIPF